MAIFNSYVKLPEGTTLVLNLHISSLNPDPKSRQSSVQNHASWRLGDYILTISGITIQRAIPVTSCRMEPKRSKGDISRSKRHSRPGILGEAANHQFTWTTHCYWLIISLVLADYWLMIGLWKRILVANKHRFSYLADDWSLSEIIYIYINGHFRILKWRYLPYVRPKIQAYVREYNHKIWPKIWY